jgi:hypothetical protein
VRIFRAHVSPIVTLNAYGGLYLSGILLRHALSQAPNLSQQIVSTGQFGQNKDWRFAGCCKNLALRPLAQPCREDNKVETLRPQNSFSLRQGSRLSIVPRAAKDGATGLKVLDVIPYAK